MEFIGIGEAELYDKHNQVIADRDYAPSDQNSNMEGIAKELAEKEEHLAGEVSVLAPNPELSQLSESPEVDLAVEHYLHLEVATPLIEARIKSSGSDTISEFKHGRHCKGISRERRAFG
nr:hypothetical protein Iba_chr10bCG11150 [Ipomoea batatas]